MISTHTFQLILWQALALFLLVGAVTGMVVAVLMIYRPKRFECLNRAANTWISTRRMSRLVDRTLSVEQWFYRHHRVLGVLICLGALYVLGYFGLILDKTAALQHLPAHLPIRLQAPVIEGLLDALVLASLTGGTVSLLVGLALWLRPSLLHGLEAVGNQWLTLRRPTRFLDLPREQIEAYVMSHSRGVGWLLLLASLFLLLLILRVLF